MNTTTAPVACALAGKDYEVRLGLIADLTRDGLLGHTRRDLTLELRYRRDCADRVTCMVRLEQTCCAFLAFEVTVPDGHVLLAITAPERAREVADQLFAQFLPGEPAKVETTPGASLCVGRRRASTSVERRP